MNLFVFKSSNPATSRVRRLLDVHCDVATPDSCHFSRLHLAEGHPQSWKERAFPLAGRVEVKAGNGGEKTQKACWECLSRFWTSHTVQQVDCCVLKNLRSSMTRLFLSIPLYPLIAPV